MSKVFKQIYEEVEHDILTEEKISISEKLGPGRKGVIDMAKRHGGLVRGGDGATHIDHNLDPRAGLFHSYIKHLEKHGYENRPTMLAKDLPAYRESPGRRHTHRVMIHNDDDNKRVFFFGS